MHLHAVQALRAGCLLALIKLLHSGSLACQTAAARALAPLVLNDSNKGPAMRDGIVPLLTRMLDNGAEGVRVGGALAIAGLAANNEDCQVGAEGECPLNCVCMGEWHGCACMPTTSGAAGSWARLCGGKRLGPPRAKQGSVLTQRCSCEVTAVAAPKS